MSEALEKKPSVMAIGCHPDDIEFMMAGTLFLLGERGWDIHYMNLADGSCGSLELNADRTAETRMKEARKACRYLGATWYPPIASDVELTYQIPLVRKVASIIRKVDPRVLLIPSLCDYMEDHMFTARIAATAAFVRGMPNFTTDPESPIRSGEIALYHALPYGLRDSYNKIVIPDFVVNVGDVLEMKTMMLSKHESQRSWLGETQRVDSYIESLKDMSIAVAAMTQGMDAGEAWIRHNPLGYSGEGFRPLEDELRGLIEFIDPVGVHETRESMKHS